MTRNSFRHFAVATTAAAILAMSTLAGLAEDATSNATSNPWPDLAREIFKGRPLADGAGLIALDMPYRAEDAAIVPLTVRTTLPLGDPRHMSALTIVIDQNPSPVAAVFSFGKKAAVSAISTRVRVNSYTDVHAVAEIDGKLYVVKTFVKAAGGCSAPAIKDAADAKVNLGQMRFRQFTGPAASSAPQQAQLMIRHPNNSGLQMDQVTHYYIPAFFVDDLKIWQGGDLVLAMNGGISISENPTIRFTYVSNGAPSFRAQAVDTEKHIFKGEWPAKTSGM